MGEVEVHIVGDGEVEFAVAIVINEGTAGAPLFSCSGDAGLLGHLFEGAIALVVEEAVFAVGSDVDVVEPVVVVVPDACTLAPACRDEPCLGSDIGEGTVVIFMEEVVSGFVLFGLGLCAWQVSAVDEEDVGPAVAVVVENGDAGAGGLDNVMLRLDAAIAIANGNSRLRRHVNEPRRGRVIGRRWIRLLREGDR
jgi:hypothetical protein